jgi:ElaB/YqjD/DUF883 family membrane-anchored ribosome-binding protein
MEELLSNHGQTFPGDEPKVSVYTIDSELEKRARQIGTMAGQFVARIRRAGRFTEPGGPIDDLRSRAAQKADEFREQAATWAKEWRQTAQEKSADFTRRARASYEQARGRTNQLGHDYPWHVLLAAGIAGFVLGAALRVRRASHGL